jgi:DNA-binding GntR family transcriptional regulator
MKKIRKIQKSKSTTQKTYRQLEKAISQNELIPGQLLVITELAADLGVSRTPVREALLMLEKAGLVEIDNGRMIVSGLSLDDLEEVFEFRQAIELFALEKTIEQCSNSQLQTFHTILEPYKHTTSVPAEAIAKADLAFHRSLVVHAGNGRMLTSWDQMATQLRRFWQDEQHDNERVQRDIEECLDITQSIKARNTLAAAHLLREHLQRTKLSLTSWKDSQRLVATIS